MAQPQNASSQLSAADGVVAGCSARWALAAGGHQLRRTAELLMAQHQDASSQLSAADAVVAGCSERWGTSRQPRAPAQWLFADAPGRIWQMGAIEDGWLGGSDGSCSI